MFFEEHMFGATESDALRTKLQRDARICWRVRIGAHAEFAHRISPRHQRAELAGEFRLAHRHLAGQNLAGRAVDRDDGALPKDVPGNAHGSRGIVDVQRARAGNAGLSHAPRNHGGVRGHAAARR